MESRWKLLYFCPPPQAASDQRAEPGEESKARFPFPPAPAQLKTKAPFSGTAQTFSTASPVFKGPRPAGDCFN